MFVPQHGKKPREKYSEKNRRRDHYPGFKRGCSGCDECTRTKADAAINAAHKSERKDALTELAMS